jgi:hypothetical protein
MKRMFLRSLAGFMAVVFVALGSGFTFAPRNEGFTEIVFVGDFDREKAELITALLNSEEIAVPRSILYIFGHIKEQTTVVVTEHRVWATSPRCRRITYDVTYCTRSSCDYVVMTVRSQIAIVCC